MKRNFKRFMVTIIFILFIIIGYLGFYAFREIGQQPTPAEIQRYAQLPYFKNGRFQSPMPQVVDMKNIRNGDGSVFLRFLTKSKFAPKHPFPTEPLNRESFAKTPENFGFYWLGHSSVIFELAGKRLIVDPVFDNAAPLPFVVPRYMDAPISRKDLPPIDYVIITHNHYDHLERKTVQHLKDSHFIVPLGVGAALRGWGISADRITELGWGDTFYLPPIRITAETASHFSGRQFSDRDLTLWNSYVIQTPTHQIFWAGDTGYSPHFAAIGEKYGPFDLVTMEIDGWNTGWKNTHLFPNEVLQAMTDLKSRNLLPVHWGIFDLALHPYNESVEMLYQSVSQTDVNLIVPQMGAWGTTDTVTKKWWF